MDSPEDAIYQDDDFDNGEYRVDLMKSLLTEIFAPKINKKTGEVRPEDKQHAAIRNYVLKLIEILSRYQNPEEDWDHANDVATIEKDMIYLTTYSAPVAEAGFKLKANASRWHAMGRKAGAEALLSEKKRLQANKKNYVASAAAPLQEKAKGLHQIEEAKTASHSEALIQLAAHADKLCNVLKKVHDRMLQEYRLSGRA
jgi:hypothetical protein